MLRKNPFFYALEQFLLKALIKLSSETSHYREMERSLRLAKLVKRDDF